MAVVPFTNTTVAGIKLQLHETGDPVLISVNCTSVKACGVAVSDTKSAVASGVTVMVTGVVGRETHSWRFSVETVLRRYMVVWRRKPD